ncbi:hypothetical protein ELR50_11215 [Pseudomonas citronellolis]|uniref:hypothetical protein n=1 Tax=Pseudomonas citronellolis TaxID=53408 RepID=UPI0022BA3004|nr:hypothetical protein [Pseudomonas citronellolis]WBG63406.1 hypothetical protein ELR50_11215 [Pseudomonas citronellolis]
MTTFVIKNADFSGGRLVDYDCPIPDAQVCSWLGGGLDDAVRNFGSGDELVVGGAPMAIDDLWCRVSAAGFLETGEVMTGNMTFIVVPRLVGSLATGVNRPAIISNESGDALVKAGYTLWMGTPTAPETRNIWSNLVYTAPNGTQYIANSGLKNAERDITKPLFVIGEATRHTSGWLRTTIETYSEPAESQGINAGAFTGPFEFPGNIRIGAMHRADSSAMMAPVDVAFVMVVQRLLTEAEKRKVYNSVRRRFAAFGVTI